MYNSSLLVSVFCCHQCKCVVCSEEYSESEKMYNSSLLGFVFCCHQRFVALEIYLLVCNSSVLKMGSV